MSSGKVHNTFSVSAAVFGCVSSIAIGDPVGAVLFPLGALTGMWLTPDLDQETTNRIEGKMLRHRFFPVKVLGYVYVFYWLPYAKWLPHRSPISHWPVLGTAVRLIYLSPVLIALALLFGIDFQHILLYNTREISLFLLGLVTSDTLHFVLDLPVSRPLGAILDDRL